MAQEPNKETKASTSDGASKPAGKIVISSVVTHAKLLDIIKERNPIIARRGERKSRA